MTPSRRRRRQPWLLCLLLLLVWGFHVSAHPKAGTKQPRLDTFFCSVDQDGDGEIERHEATKFLHKLDAASVGELPSEFSYGGKTICSEEMRDHLQNMLTPDRVVNWITHGLQLPQYAEAFQKNAIDGLDFLWLIENESWALSEELGVASQLHRSKITNAIVRQIFGFGSPPGAPLRVQCQSSSWSGIQLSWDPPVTLGYPPLHKYLVHRWSKASSSWVPLTDTKETSFLDTTGLHVGKAYSYRIQAWGGHGPSDWVTIENCTALISRPLSQPENTPSKKKMKNMEADAGNTTRWGWVFSLNGSIFLVGLLTRQRFFFRISLAVCMVIKLFFKRLVLKIFKAQLSDKIWIRTLARALVLVYRCCISAQSKLLLLSRQVCCTEAAAAAAAGKADSFRDAIGYSTVECTLDEMLDAIQNAKVLGNKSANFEPLEGARAFTQMTNRINDNSRTSSAPSFVHDGHVTPDVRSLSAPALVQQQPDGSEAGVQTPNTGSLRELETSHQRRRTRHRCNFEGCKNRFDRWYYPPDLRMRFSKHYCRECQRVFCVKHTRISPHGATGRCGLESSCICVNCFKHMSTEAQEKLERLNKLRVGPAVQGSGSSGSDPFPPDFGALDSSSTARSSYYLNQDPGSTGSLSSRSSCSSFDGKEEGR